MFMDPPDVFVVGLIEAEQSNSSNRLNCALVSPAMTFHMTIGKSHLRSVIMSRSRNIFPSKGNVGSRAYQKERIINTVFMFVEKDKDRRRTTFPEIIRVVKTRQAGLDLTVALPDI